LTVASRSGEGGTWVQCTGPTGSRARCRGSVFFIRSIQVNATKIKFSDDMSVVMRR